MCPNSYAISVKFPDKNLDLTHTKCLTYKCRQLVHWHIDGQQALFHSLLRRGSRWVSPSKYQNINNRKNRKRAGDDGKRETAGALSLLSSPFPSCPARSLFLSPQPPHNTKSLPTTQRGLCGGESLFHLSLVTFPIFHW